MWKKAGDGKYTDDVVESRFRHEFINQIVKDFRCESW